VELFQSAAMSYSSNQQSTLLFLSSLLQYRLNLRSTLRNQSKTKRCRIECTSLSERTWFS